MLGAELRAIRKSRGLSLRELAYRAGISREGLGGIERGERYPSLQTLEKLVDCLDIRVVIGPLETHIDDP